MAVRLTRARPSDPANHKRAYRVMKASVAGREHLVGADIRNLMALSIEHRFDAVTTPHCVEWHSDNGPLYTHRLLESLHVKLRKVAIWLWTRGAIEEHLGLAGKNEATWMNLVQGLESKGADELPDDVRGLMAWVVTKLGSATSRRSCARGTNERRPDHEFASSARRALAQWVRWRMRRQ